MLRAEGLIDEDLPARLADALKAHEPEEIWLRSRAATPAPGTKPDR